MSDQSAAVVEHQEENEGHSVAGWTGVTIILLGFLVGAFAMILNQELFVWIGVGLVGVGVLAWIVLAALGFGPGPKER